MIILICYLPRADVQQKTFHRIYTCYELTKKHNPSIENIATVHAACLYRGMNV